MPTSSVKPLSGVQSSASNEEIIQQRLPRPICWHEGMLLSPQHFQQNHQYWEGQLRRLVATLAPHFWGIAELRIDLAALWEGEVSIQRLRGIMPDGLVVDYDHRSDAPLKVSLGQLEAKPVTVQLAVPIQVPGSASERSEIQRYTSRDDQPRIDENTGDNEVVMPRLEAKLSLKVADRVSNSYIGLPLLRIVKPESGSLRLDPQYSPPLLAIGADNFREGSDDIPGAKPIQQRAKALALAIRYKVMQLAGISDEGEQMGSAIRQRYHRWIRAMVQELPPFELMAIDPTTTPKDLYQCMVRLATAVSELSNNPVPPRFPGYCHDDHLPAFNQVAAYIKRQVERVNLNYTTVSFEQQRPGIFTLAVEKSWLEKDFIIELRPGKEGGGDSVQQWLDSCRIASESRHKLLAQRRLLGAQTEAIEREAKADIVAAPGNQLFRIHWDKRFILAGERLVLVSTNSQAKALRPKSILLHIPHD